MNKYVKSFVFRGLIFGGGGPLVLGVVYIVLAFNSNEFSLSGAEAFCGIFSTYLLAFIHAGASVFNQIERWPIAKSIFFHFLTVYCAYLLCYLLNSWIPFKPRVILIFTLAFVVAYFVVWLTSFIIARHITEGFNEKLKNELHEE